MTRIMAVPRPAATQGASGLRPGPGRERLFPRGAGLEAIRAAAAEAVRTVVSREEVVAALRAYNAELGNPAGEELCDALADPDALVIVAGQQPGVFAGPMLVFSKAVQAAGLARRVAENRRGPVVPIFWNHSEDHDVDEAAVFFDFRSGSVARKRAPLGSRRTALESLRVTEELVEFARSVLDKAGLEGADLMPVEGERYSLWTARVLETLLAGVPLLHAEPRILRPLLGPVLGGLVEATEALAAAALEGADRVRAEGHEVQVEVKNPSRLFWIGEDGSRRRLLYEKGAFLPLRGAFDRSLPLREAADLARAHPGHFSPDVLLRPVILQSLLPVAAHVCGPGESAYFAQLPPLFERAGRPLPAVVSRPRVTVLGPREERMMAESGLDPILLVSDPPRAFAAAAAAGSEIPGRTRHHLLEWIRPRGRSQERVLGPLVLLREHDPRATGRLLSGIDPLAAEEFLVVP